MSKKFSPSITIRMGATHSDITVKGSAPIDTSKASTRDLWEMGKKVAQATGIKGDTPSVKANTKKGEAAVTINTRRTAKPNGTKPDNHSGKTRSKTHQDKRRDGHEARTLQPSPDVDGAKKRSRRRSKPSAVPTSGR